MTLFLHLIVDLVLARKLEPIALNADTLATDYIQCFSVFNILSSVKIDLGINFQRCNIWSYLLLFDHAEIVA